MASKWEKGGWYVHGSHQITLAWHVDLGAKETQPNHKAKQPFLVMIWSHFETGHIPTNGGMFGTKDILMAPFSDKNFALHKQVTHQFLLVNFVM
jgi:hypothetical protein